MPKAELPKNWRGWVAATVSSLVGFISGLVALAAITKKWK